MPIYASNLDFVPLEPIKQEIPVSLSYEFSELSSVVKKPDNVDIQFMQFDWTGLTTILDRKYFFVLVHLKFYKSIISTSPDPSSILSLSSTF